MDRDNFTSNYAWSIPDKDSILQIVEFEKDKGSILEVGSGLGLWSSILKMFNLNIIVTYNFSYYGLEKLNDYNLEKNIFTTIEKIDGIDAMFIS